MTVFLSIIREKSQLDNRASKKPFLFKLIHNHCTLKNIFTAVEVQ